MRKSKVFTATIMTFLYILTLLAMVFMASAALSITLNPTTGEPDESVEVTGTDFAASSPVG